MRKIEGKRALITGGSSGIGLATAKLFIAEGARVAITGRNPDTLKAAVDELGTEALAIPGDITDSDERARLFAELTDEFGALDILFANAGLTGFTKLGATSEADFETIVRINLTSVFFTMQDALPLLSDGASVILNGSVSATLAVPASAAYAASKAGVAAMARAFAADLRGRPVRVNVVIPGATLTPSWTRDVSPQQHQQNQELVSRTIPMGRWADADEVARAVLFLASDDASFVHGTELVVDGGQTGLPGIPPARSRAPRAEAADPHA